MGAQTQRPAWATDPERIKTETVQLWSASGVMLTARLSKADAQELVRSGKAHVISAQAIGY